MANFKYYNLDTFNPAWYEITREDFWESVAKRIEGDRRFYLKRNGHGDIIYTYIGDNGYYDPLFKAVRIEEG